ncbi:MAG: cell envelope integrity protein TolA [Nitrosospira sp.]|nr:cell envelope integrity protein TolA [Nitrosospira sp.]
MSALALRDSAHPEPGLLPAGVLALLVHVAFLVFMIFGLNWKSYPPEGMVVDLWNSLPEPAPPPARARPLPPKLAPSPPEVKPLPPKPETPPPTKPDIALKEKVEPPKPVEKKQPAPEEQKPKVADDLEQLVRDQEALEKQRAQQAAQSRAQDVIAEYKAKIMAKIRSRIVLPPNIPDDSVAELDVTLLPGGDILNVRLRKSSGYAAFDSAVERAIYLAKPLPLPPDPALFPKFRDLSLKVHYRE